MFLSCAAAAAGIALINSASNPGGIAGPIAIGWAKDATQGFAGGLYFIAVCTGIAALLVIPAGRGMSPLRMGRGRHRRGAAR